MTLSVRKHPKDPQGTAKGIPPPQGKELVMNGTQIKRAVLSALTVVCLGAAAIVPLCALPALFEQSEWYGVKITTLQLYFSAAVILSAVALFVSCVGLIRGLPAAEDQSKALVIRGHWIAFPLNLLLCFTTWSWRTDNTAFVLCPALAIGLIVLALVSLGARNRTI